MLERAQSQRRAFMKELEAMIHLRHAHTVNVYGAFDDRSQGPPCLRDGAHIRRRPAGVLEGPARRRGADTAGEPHTEGRLQRLRRNGVLAQQGDRPWGSQVCQRAVGWSGRG